MLVELLLVGVILSYLYAVGFLDINDPRSIVISIAVIFAVMVIGWIVTRFVALSVVDSLLGLKTGSRPGQPPRQRAAKASLTANAFGDKLPVLERLVREVPRDPDVSLQLSEEYLRRGMIEQFLAERARMLSTGVLGREQAVMALNRMADVEAQRGNIVAALAYTQEIIARFPDSDEAAHAKLRTERLMQMARSADSDATTP